MSFEFVEGREVSHAHRNKTKNTKDKFILREYSIHGDQVIFQFLLKEADS